MPGERLPPGQIWVAVVIGWQTFLLRHLNGPNTLNLGDVNMCFLCRHTHSHKHRFYTHTHTHTHRDFYVKARMYATASMT